MAVSSYTQTLARFAVEARTEDLSSEAVAATKRVALDTLGCAVGGRGVASSEILTRVRAAPGGAEEATVLVGGERLPLPAAAFLNAHYANALDAEETIRHSGHLAACAVPPALSAAEALGSSGAELLAAIAVGFDVAARIGLSLRHIDLLDDGTVEIAPVAGLSWAAFASTVAAGRLLGLDADGMAQAFGITVATAPLPIAGQWGNLPAPRPMTKYGMYGTMAEAGVTAARLAAEGFAGDPTILDGDRGFWRIMGSRRCQWDTLTDRLGQRWLIEETSFKVYPACRFATPALDLFYDLQAQAGAEADLIAAVDVRVPHAMMAKHMDDPDVRTVVDGQFSVPHVLGLAACMGPPGPRWHSVEAMSDERVRDFATRVSVRVYPEAAPIMEGLIRQQGHCELIPTAMTLTTTDGRTFEARTDHASGDPWEQDAVVADAELQDKFRLFCEPFLPYRQIDEVIGCMESLEDLPEVTRLVSALVSGG
ncbi:MAG: MmgE/PrpD family protein [Acidimicrobiaceae bacterium]|nr:MmgE/PrpD family protein [Acidimicrobiaceae bacterium]